MGVISKLIGVFLCLVGLGFLALLIWLRVDGSLAGDIRVSAVMVGCAGLLLWIGSSWLLPKPESEVREDTDSNLGGQLMKLRRPAEVIAAGGSVLMLCHAIGLLLDTEALPTWLLASVVLAPVVLAWYIVRILAAGAFPYRAFAETAFIGWSRTARLVVHVVMRVGWFGYFTILLFWFRVDVLLPDRWALTLRVVISLLVSLLYASQLLLLHFGNLRKRISEHAM